VRIVVGDARCQGQLLAVAIGQACLEDAAAAEVGIGIFLQHFAADNPVDARSIDAWFQEVESGAPVVGVEIVVAAGCELTSRFGSSRSVSPRPNRLRCCQKNSPPGPSVVE